jgi:hypothetical protein
MSAKGKGANLPQQPSGEGEMTLLFVRMKGNNSTFQQVSQALQQAINAGHSTPQRRVLEKTANAIDAEHGSGHQEELQEQSENADAVAQNESVDSAGDTVVRQAPEPRSFRKPELVPNFDPDKFNPTLQAFIDTLKLGDEATEKYLAIAYWLTKHAKIENFDVDYIYSCYTTLSGWTIPDRAAKVLSNLRQDDMLSAGKGKGFYTLTVPGQKRIEALIQVAK